jgi:hypothetical protein
MFHCKPSIWGYPYFRTPPDEFPSDKSNPSRSVTAPNFTPPQAHLAVEHVTGMVFLVPTIANRNGFV